MFGRSIEDQRMLAWIIFTVFVSTSARTIFKSSTNLTNLVVDERTGELYAGATNFIYKLDNKLDMIGKANTTCIISCPDGSQKLDNINQILLLDNFFNGRGLLACGTNGGGTCAILNISTLTPYARSGTKGIVSYTMKYPSVALFDPANQEILISSTRLIDPKTTLVRTPDLAAYHLNKKKLVVKRSADLYLSKQRPKTTVIAGVIVGEYRYFFTVSGDGSRIVRLCKSYKKDQSIITYVEMPLFCAGSNGEKFEHLHKVKVVLPGSKLARSFGISVNDSVVVGVFMKSETAFESAVCVYSFQQINNLFWRNIEKCLTANLADKLLRNEYQPNYCVTEGSLITNCIPDEYKNQIIIGRIHCKGNAILTCSTCHLSSSLDVVVYGNDTIAFIGTRSGKLAKVLISPNSSGKMYELSSRINGSSILSVNLQPNRTHVYLMTSDKIVKIPVQECNDRKTCESCVGNGDPYCGWCTLFAKCTIQSDCPYASHHLGYVQSSSQCINISNIHPRELPLSEQHHKVNISIENLPPRNPRDAYNCHINGINVTSALIDETTLECSTPVASQLPRANFQTGKVAVKVAVYSVETKIEIVSSTLKFYNCSAISNCFNCTTGSLMCSWCNYEATCIAAKDVSTSCNSSVSWVGNVSSHQCPILKSQTINIPASIEREVVVNAMQLPEPSKGTYKCVVTVDGTEFPSSAIRNNASSLTCGRTEYKYSPETKTFPARLRIELGRSIIEPEGDVAVTLYKCHVPAKDCGSCLGKWESQYQCGWCPKSDCVVRDGCKTEDWVGPYGTCSAIPKITWFYPSTGPVAGNTTLEINGTELGRKFEDVNNISIGHVPCHAVKAKYIISKRIVCRTSRSYKGPFGDKIKVAISDKVGYSTKFFHYQEPVVEDFEPKVGLVSGGTLLKITGKHLNTGRNIKVTVGRSPCHIVRPNETFITCKTSSYNKRRRRSSDSVKSEGIVVTFDGSQPESLPKETFAYVLDPNITDITPRYTFPSSDVPLTVTGTNLYAVQNRQIVLQFESRRFQNVCGKPTKSQSQMICELPDVSPVSENDSKATISLVLDDVTKWRDLSGYSFNSIVFVPDPHIIAFNKEKGKKDEEVRILSADALEITGSNLVAQVDRNLIQFVITVGGQLCNITSKGKDIIYCKLPKQSSLPEQESYDVVVNVTSSRLSFNVGKVKFPTDTTPSSKDDRSVMYIIIGVCGAVLIVFVILMICVYRRKRKQQRQTERTFELQMNSLESKVAKECREAFAELQTDMTDFTTDLGGSGIHFFGFKNYAMRVLFPGVDQHVVMEEKRLPESPKWEEALRTFSQLIGNKNFLIIFVKTLEHQQQFKMQDRCNVASLLVIALQNKMEYCTEILQYLLAELIRKSMSKSHPKLLLRRTECIAEKLLTNWLTFTLSNFIKDKAGKPLFMLYKAIRFQVEKGPIDAITNEARYSLSEDKLLRQSIDYNTLTVTVEYEDNPPVQVEVLDTDTIGQTKDKIMEVLFKNIPYSSRIPKDELNLKWVESPSNHRILKDEDSTSIIEGEWKKVNTLAHYEVPDRTCLRLVRRFASPFDTSDLQSSFSKESYSPTIASNQSFLRRSRNNLTDADIKPYHLTKHSDYVQEKDDPRHSKLLSEIYLTRLLSTKGTLQQYVDDLFDAIFLTFRKTERPPLPIKFLFDFLDKQAEELNITDPEVLHTWKNNSLPLRFWVNLIKNPDFLFDVYKAPIVDSCLTVIAQLFMDACSVTEHRLGKDSPSNKLLYAKEIPAYKQKVESFYQDVSDAPQLTEEEIKNFYSSHHTEEFNVDNALKELYKYAAKYQDELQEALEESRHPQLASKLEHVVAVFSDD